METRRTSLALVLALLAGMIAASGQVPSSLVEQSDAVDDASRASHIRHLSKRLDAPRRHHRKRSQERPVAVPAATFVLSVAKDVAAVASLAQAIVDDQKSNPVALARAPPHA